MKALVIMTRIPVPNRTKTRLLTILSPEECAGIHRSFLRDIVETSSELDRDTDIYLFYGDEGPLGIIEDIIPKNIATLPQKGRDLGEKMRNIFAELFDKGYDEVVLMGSDIPEVSAGDLNEAFNNLTAKDIVFGPTLDGGYYLVGMKKLHEIIFTPVIKWGTPQVFQETIDLLGKNGVNVGLIKTHEDIDTKEDLKEFWNRIKDSRCCKNTRRYICEDIRERLLCRRV